MKGRAIYFMLAFVGVALIVGAVYVQSLSMDLNKFTVWQYAAADFVMPAWWASIAAPFGVGFIYICIAAVCMRTGPTPRAATRIFAACIALALLLRFGNVVLGDIAMISAATFFLVSYRRSKRELSAT